jgi:CBS domain-containing protein
MQVYDVMSQGVECMRPNATLEEAARKMRELDVGALPVCGNNDRIVGMLTDRDIVIRAEAEGKDPHTTPVRDAMTPGVVYCFEDQDVRDAARLMRDRQIRRLVVLDRDKQLAGIVSLGDLAIDVDDPGLTADTLAGVSEPAVPMP